MLTRLRRHLTYANVMSTIAVFLTLGGGVAWALSKNSVSSKHIVNGQVKAVDIENSQTVFGSEAISAETLDGFKRGEFVVANQSDPGLQMIYHSHYLDTLTSATFDYGQINLKTVGVADTLQVCNDAGGTLPIVIYLGAVRTQESVAGSTCTADKLIPDGGDFGVTARGTQIFGQHSGDSATSNGYSAFSFSYIG